MEKHSAFFYIFLAFILFLCLIIYYQSDAFDLKCIISSRDGNKYCVRERDKMELAANLLADATQKMKDVVNYLKEKQPNDPRTKRLTEGFDPKKVNDNLYIEHIDKFEQIEFKEIFFKHFYTCR